MPEMYFDVRWPDGLTQRCYSPSTIVEDYFTPGAEYELAEFVERSRTALGIAGERVREKFGFFCTGASDQLARIERTAAAYGDVGGAKVTVESLLGADGSPR
ncbi:MSMEG_0570 family nitrogen starvation response protein [Streptomyces sp. MBT65]|uniref:MSMEG_0570 family nitrogen starvation response protein n=1 Tax=Streptomyces sp. MBT65 TaxID=1488395 RepID=UPI001909691B|nr:MSMEG_0570 family nitrogen starvation response protein [Streptomyces sp. MBT65]MBK3577248.1 MSMEG_0570 family nitrogen starvation response protein [Streptomyces sp. MBT65]